jgi:hypothetical protein
MKKLAILLSLSALLLGTACGRNTRAGSVVSPSPTVSVSETPTVGPSYSASPSPSRTPSHQISSSPTPVPAPIFSGRVTNAAGRALAGICLTIIEPSNDDRFRNREGPTGSDGRFVVNLGPWGNFPLAGWSVEFWDCNASPVYAPVFTRADLPSSGSLKNLNATLTVGAAITGDAVDQNGNVAAGACVAIYDGSHNRSGDSEVLPDYSIRADSSGHFKFSGLESKVQKIVFGDCKGSAFKVQWYKNWSNEAPQYGNFENSDPITVSAGNTTDVGTVTITRIS